MTDRGSTLHVSNISSKVHLDYFKKWVQDMTNFTPVSARLAGDASRESRYGFVEFETTDECNIATELINNATLAGRSLRASVAHSNPPPRRSHNNYRSNRSGHRSDHRHRHRSSDYKSRLERTVYVSNLNANFTIDMLRQLFSLCGTFTLAKLCGDRNKETRFAFLEFETKEGADKAISVSGADVFGRPLIVAYSRSCISTGPTELTSDQKTSVSKTVYLNNIHPSTRLEDLCDLIRTKVSSFHKLSLVDLSKSKRSSSAPPNRPLIAFVEFWDPEVAKTALALDGLTFNGTQLTCELSKTPILNPSILFDKDGNQLDLEVTRSDQPHYASATESSENAGTDSPSPTTAVSVAALPITSSTSSPLSDSKNLNRVRANNDTGVIEAEYSNQASVTDTNSSYPPVPSGSLNIPEESSHPSSKETNGVSSLQLEPNPDADNLTNSRLKRNVPETQIPSPPCTRPRVSE